MSQCVMIDIDGTMSPALVALLELLPRDIGRIVCTARYESPGAFSDTWAELMEYGLVFDELHMRPIDPVMSPGVFKAGIVDQLRGWGVEPILAFDDDPSVGQWYGTLGVPVIQVKAPALPASANYGWSDGT